MRRIQVLPFPPGRCDVNTRYFPSGDQRGLELSVLGDVKRLGSPPDVGTTQTSRWYLSSFSLTVCTWNAMRLPSGEIAGELRTVSLYQSLRAKARLACCAASGVAVAAARARSRVVLIDVYSSWR